MTLKILLAMACLAPALAAQDRSFVQLTTRTDERLVTGQSAAAEAELRAALPRYRNEPRAYTLLLNSLGNVYHAAGDYDRAETTLRAAIDASRPLLQQGDLELLAPFSNLLSLYLDYEQLGKADRLHKQLDRMAPQWRTAPHIVSEHLYCLLATLEITQGRFGQAEPLLLRAAELAALRQVTVSEELSILNNLAILYLSTGRLDQALEQARRANQVAGSEAADPVQHAMILVNLAVAEGRTGHAADARQHFEAGMAIAGQNPDAAQPALANILLAGAAYLKDAGRKHDAKQLLKKAEAIRGGLARNTSLGMTVDYQSFQSRK